MNSAAALAVRNGCMWMGRPSGERTRMVLRFIRGPHSRVDTERLFPDVFGADGAHSQALVADVLQGERLRQVHFGEAEGLEVFDGHNAFLGLQGVGAAVFGEEGLEFVNEVAGAIAGQLVAVHLQLEGLAEVFADLRFADDGQEGGLIGELVVLLLDGDADGAVLGRGGRRDACPTTGRRKVDDDGAGSLGHAMVVLEIPGADVDADQFGLVNFQSALQGFILVGAGGDARGQLLGGGVGRDGGVSELPALVVPKRSARLSPPVSGLHYRNLELSYRNTRIHHMKLAGKTALVTGSSQGIGEAVALRLAEEG